jgi:hypothetical protein
MHTKTAVIKDNGKRPVGRLGVNMRIIFILIIMN